MFDLAAHDMAPFGVHGERCEYRQVIRLGATARKHDFGRRGAESLGHRLPRIQNKALGVVAEAVLARGIEWSLSAGKH